MPLYIYQNPDTQEVKEVYQGINDKHEYSTQDKYGMEIRWVRIFTVPNASVGSNVNPFSRRQFLEKTSSRKGTYGDMADESRELSEKRAAQNGGVDPVKQKYFKEYSKSRGGVKHPDDKS